jgi:beta-N-acetylhexosaminidase
MIDQKLERNFYQLIIGRLDGNRVDSKAYEQEILGLVEKGIGGFILFGGKKEKIVKFIKKIQSFSTIPLFIASDIERGVGQQIRGTTVFPCQMAIAAAINREESKDIKLLKDVIEVISKEAVISGINMPLIPVLDINQNPDNPIICTRAFSDNKKTISWFGSKYVKYLQRYSLISCVKHFPGHGDTSVDSHITLPIIRKSKKDLLKNDLFPFIHAIKNGVNAIMIGHLLVPALSSELTTVSKEIVTDLLKDELGFRGLVISDALNMGALKGIKNISVRSFKAGIDLILHPLNPEKTVKELTNGFKNKEIKIKEIDERLEKILKMKSKIKNTQLIRLDYDKNRDISKIITEKAITLLKGDQRYFSESNYERKSIFFIGDRNLFNNSPIKHHRGVREKISKNALILIFTAISAWKGNSGISNEELRRVKKIIKNSESSCVVSFGNPYILRYFKEADALIAAYDSSYDMQLAVVRALKGEIVFQGSSPVNINL